MYDVGVVSMADLREIDRVHTAMADALIARLEKTHPPQRMARFFPAEMSPVPDLGFAKTFGAETLEDVRLAAECVIEAAAAREELALRKFPN